MGALALVLGVGLFVAAPDPRHVSDQLESPAYALFQALYALAGGALLLATLSARPAPTRGWSTYVGRLMGTALLLQTAGLFVGAVAAQLTWGTYWSWNAVESWRLASWLANAIVGMGISELEWRARSVRWASGVAFVLLFLSSLGGSPLLRWLGTASPYVRP